MRIDPNAKLPEVPDSKTLNRPGNSSRSVSPDRTAEVDQATLAVQSRAQELQIRLQQMPEDRRSRVEALTRAVRDGEYKVGTEQIAQSLFAEMSARSVLLR
jgi:flagellar biosynthesis anti-sigma factor FlgM